MVEYAFSYYDELNGREETSEDVYQSEDGDQ